MIVMAHPSTMSCLLRLTDNLFDSVADFFPNEKHATMKHILQIQLECMISVESRCGMWRVERYADKRDYFPYIGRGWFQLTHKSNYEKAMAKLKVSEAQLIRILVDPELNERQLEVWFDYFSGFRSRFVRLYKSPSLINARSKLQRAVIALVWTPVSLVAGTKIGTLDRVLFYRDHAQEPEVIAALLKSN